MDIEACYKIGYVARTHGLKGEVTIILGADSPALQKDTSVLIEIKHDLVPYFVERVSDRGDKTFVKFEDVENPEQANRLKGCSLYLAKKARPTLKLGAFYNDEVVGFEAVDNNLGMLGKIKEVTQIGPNRLLVIEGSSREILVPVIGPFILSINKSKKKISLDLPDGFLDI